VSPGQAALRQAVASDIPGIQLVRRLVRENRLVSLAISDEQVRAAIEDTGRGWVVESGGEVVAFAIGNAGDGNIWALFVHPDHEGRGHGRRMHDAMVEWLWSRGLERLWLTTAPGTRAQSFYEAAGWERVPHADAKELRYELGRARPEAVVQAQLDAYNAKDIEALLATYAPDAEQYAIHGERLARGHTEMRARFLARFAEPDLHARLLSRSAIDAFVIDHELITRNFPEGRGTLEMMCIYEVRGSLIRKATFVSGNVKRSES
jgi:putative hydrolase of HD superfamily